MAISCPRLAPGLVLLAGGLMLAGCLDTGANVAGGAPQPAPNRPEASPRGAPVAFTSLDGAPQPVAARFLQALASAAKEDEISVASRKSARYFARGYLSAYPTERGTALEFVWDVFDAEHHRTQRIDDGVSLGGNGGDPWGGVDDKALQDVAAKSAQDLAAFLATTPEATAAAAESPGEKPAPPSPKATASGAPQPSLTALSYAAAN